MKFGMNRSSESEGEKINCKYFGDFLLSAACQYIPMGLGERGEGEARSEDGGGFAV